jgi:hypothetical protein
MFTLSTIYWVFSVVETFLIIRAWFSELDPATHSPPDWLPMFSAVLLANVSNLTKLFFFTAAMHHPHDLTRSLISLSSPMALLSGEPGSSVPT